MLAAARVEPDWAAAATECRDAFGEWYTLSYRGHKALRSALRKIALRFCVPAQTQGAAFWRYMAQHGVHVNKDAHYRVALAALKHCVDLAKIKNPSGTLGRWSEQLTNLTDDVESTRIDDEEAGPDGPNPNPKPDREDAVREFMRGAMRLNGRLFGLRQGDFPVPIIMPDDASPGEFLWKVGLAPTWKQFLSIAFKVSGWPTSDLPEAMGQVTPPPLRLAPVATPMADTPAEHPKEPPPPDGCVDVPEDEDRVFES